jgi:5-methylcytosine-specific restriction endonuclease McrA
MPRKTPPFPHYPAWTTARFFGFLRSGLREKFNRYPVKYEVLKQACFDVETGETFKTGHRAGEKKTVKMYKCASCSEQYRQKDVQVDHKIPAGSLQSFNDLSGFAERLFCGPEELQILCTVCHDTKTKKDKLNV